MHNNFKYILYVILLVCFASCKAYQQLPTNTYQQQRDSVRTEYVHDSVYVERERLIRVQGDTVYMRDTVTVTRTQKVRVHDSIYIHVADTIYQIPTSVPAEKTSECDNPFIHRSGVALWVILSLLLLSVIIGIIIRFARR